MPKIYLLATNTKKAVSHLITAYTGERYNHASIAFSPDLSECYSFNMARDGFVLEDKNEWPVWTEFALYEATVTPAGLRAARTFVEEARRGGKGFSYGGLAGIMLGMPIERREAYFCSEFVERACVAAGLRATAPSPALTTPMAVCQRPGARKVAEGRLHVYIVSQLKLAEEAARLRNSQGTTMTKPLILGEGETLHEGLGAFVRNLATGNIEEDVDEIEKDAKDIHTPEQQRIVLTQIMRVMEKLVILRHNPGWVQKQVHDASAWFTRMISGADAGKELITRSTEQISRLARIRDKVLRINWEDDDANKRIREFQDSMNQTIDRARQTALSGASDDF